MVEEHKEYKDSYPFIMESEGCYEEYSSVSEFKENLTDDYLSSEKTREGWVFWSPVVQSNSINGSSDITVREKIILALSKMKSRFPALHALVQFWVPIEVGGMCYLATCTQPFAVKYLFKGICSYRKKSTQHLYLVDVAAEEKQLGPPGRVFRSRRPESSPDLKFYSSEEFPLRDHAASCGLMTYLAVPVFDLSHQQCVGVLECLNYLTPDDYPFSVAEMMHDALEVAQMRSTHEISVQVTKIRSTHGISIQYQPQQQCEIGRMLDLAIRVVPQLHVAQAWKPCKQCANSRNYFYCMEQAACAYREFSGCLQFRDACRLHKIQNGEGFAGLAFSSTNKSCFCWSLCDFSISEYSMAHYAQEARLSFCFAICMQSNGNDNDLYVFEFFLQPQSRDETHIGSLLSLLLQIMEMKLETFKIATGHHLGGELAVDEVIPRKNVVTSLESGQNITIQPFRFENQQLRENIPVMPIKGYGKQYTSSQFKDYLEDPDLCCFRAKSGHETNLIFWSIQEKVLSENNANNNSILLPIHIQEKIKIMLRKMLMLAYTFDHTLIQFWAPKMIGNGTFLSTSNQPFAIGCLYKGLCWYRKQCVEHPYYIGGGAKDEDLGPPGRAFLNGHLESSPDLRLYSIKEFPLRDHIFDVRSNNYLAIPLFDSYHEQCLGVLEYVGHHIYPTSIFQILEAANLMPSRVAFYSCFQASQSPYPNIAMGQQLSLIEISRMIEVVIKSPQLVVASVWIPCNQSDDPNIETSCLKLVKFSVNLLKEGHGTSAFIKGYKLLHVRPRKGFMGRVLSSECKMYLCENFCDFSINEEPLAHYAQVAGFGIWFAICLHSRHTGSSVYVLEFILSPGSKKYLYPQSFLCSLLWIMKNELRSFKVASGQELGRELIFQGTEFSAEIQGTYFGLDQMGSLPLRIETGHGGHTIEEYCSKKQIQSKGTDDDSNSDREQEQKGIEANFEERRASTEHNRDGGNNMGLHVSYEVLKSHFGKRLEDVAEELGVGRSTLKRKCRDYGIKRWPSKMKNKSNPSLFQTTSSKQVQDHILVQPNVPQTSVQSTREADETFQNINVVMVKAKFEDDIIMFKMCRSSGMKRLAEEVGNRLNLKIGSFKLKYLDEHGDELILLACDDDLQLYVENMRSLGKTDIRVFVHSISD